MPYTVNPSALEFFTLLFKDGIQRAAQTFLDIFASKEAPALYTNIVLLLPGVEKRDPFALEIRLSSPVTSLWGLPVPSCPFCNRQATGDPSRRHKGHLYARFYCRCPTGFQTEWVPVPDWLEPSGRHRSMFVNRFPLSEQQAAYPQTLVDEAARKGQVAGVPNPPSGKGKKKSRRQQKAKSDTMDVDQA